MSFLEHLETEESVTRTLNGAAAYESTGEACLDLFAAAGAMRYRKTSEQIRMFDRAYIEAPELAMKLLFYIRDIREGLGERRLFRVLLRHVAETWPASAEKNIALISEYGRFDDLLCLLGTPSQEAVAALIREQLEQDLQALERREEGEIDAHISLLAKWMPSINTSSKKTRAQAKALAEALQLSKAEYRKTLVKLRTQIGLAEQYLTAKKADKISYSAVPAGAMLKYRKAFERQDGGRFQYYLSKVANGTAGIHCDTVYPYEVIRPYFKSIYGFYGMEKNLGSHMSKSEKEVLELLWNQRGGEVADQNAIVVIDTSGSMFWQPTGGIMPAMIAQALGLYYAEHCTGTFHNTFITFEGRPHLMKIQGQTLEDKLRYISTAPWGMSTNLEAVFDLILSTAVKNNTPQNELPTTLYIISDMEFNSAVSNPDETIYENARKKFESCGYQLPAVVFHNVNSWQRQVPVRANTVGAALTSGAGTNSFKKKFDGNITPMAHMLRVLNSTRYAAVHA